MKETELELESLLEALLLSAGRPLSEDELLKIFAEEERPKKTELRKALSQLQENCRERGVRLVEIASGYQFQINPKWAPWVAKLWEEKAPRYSRALLETLALIAYRQPITRGEIEDIRGVSISPSIFKTLQEDREWIRVVGHREVPGRPALYATTKAFLDYFGLKALDQLPALPEIMNLDVVESQLQAAQTEEQVLYEENPTYEDFEADETFDDDEADEVYDEEDADEDSVFEEADPDYRDDEEAGAS